MIKEFSIVNILVIYMNIIEYYKYYFDNIFYLPQNCFFFFFGNNSNRILLYLIIHSYKY